MSSSSRLAVGLDRGDWCSSEQRLRYSGVRRTSKQRAGATTEFSDICELDCSDNDPVWFWMYVVAALQKVSPGMGTRAVELLAMGADPVQVVLPTLLNDLDTIASPMVLILDDYHLVVNRAVHEQVAFVIGRVPGNLQLVLATKADPMLPLARLRASADLAEMQSRRCWSAPRSSRTAVITRRRRQRGTTVSGFFSHRCIGLPDP